MKGGECVIKWNKTTQRHLKAELNKLFRDVDREGLKVIHFNKNGAIEMTNSYCAVRLRDVHDEEDNVGKFPVLDILFDQVEKSPQVVRLPEVKQICSIIKPFTQWGTESLFVTVGPSGITIENDFEPGFKAVLLRGSLKLELNCEPFSFGVNANYLYNCFMLYKKLKIKEVDMYFKSDIRPFMLRAENLDYLVAPMRIRKKRSDFN